MKLTRGLLPEVQAQETIRSDKYNKDIEVLIAAHNAQEEKLVNAEFKDVAGQVDTYADLLLLPETTPDIIQGTRIIVKEDENTGKDYVTYVYNIDLTTGQLEWVVSSVGTPLATATSDGLLAAEDYVKLQGLHQVDITGLEARLTTAEEKSTLAQAAVSSLTPKVTANTNAISSLTTRVVAAEGSVASLQSAQTALAARVTTAEGKLATLQTNLGTIQTDFTGIKTSIGTVPAGWPSIVAKIGAMDGVTSANKVILDGVKAQSDLDHADIATVKASVATNTTAIASNTTELAKKATIASVTALDGRLTTAEGKITQNKTLLDAHTTRLTKIEAKDVVQDSDIADAKARLATLEAASGASGSVKNLKSAVIVWDGELAGSATQATDNTNNFALNTLTADNGSPFSFAAKKKLEIWLQVESTSLGTVIAYVKPIVGKTNNQLIAVVRAASGTALEGISAKLALDGTLTLVRTAATTDIKMNTAKVISVSEDVLTAVADLVTKEELSALTTRVATNEGKILEVEVGVIELAYIMQNKANSADVYTKAEVDAKLATAGLTEAQVEAKITAATSSLATAASVSALTTVVNGKAEASAVETLTTTVNGKADAATVTAIDTRVTTAEGDLATAKAQVATNKADIAGHETRIAAIEAKDTAQDTKIAQNAAKLVEHDTALLKLSIDNTKLLALKTSLGI